MRAGPLMHRNVRAAMALPSALPRFRPWGSPGRHPSSPGPCAMRAPEKAGRRPWREPFAPRLWSSHGCGVAEAARGRGPRHVQAAAFCNTPPFWQWPFWAPGGPDPECTRNSGRLRNLTCSSEFGLLHKLAYSSIAHCSTLQSFLVYVLCELVICCLSWPPMVAPVAGTRTGSSYLRCARQLSSYAICTSRYLDLSLALSP